MSKIAALKNLSGELYRKVLLDTIRRLWSSYKNMETVRELLHVAFPSDKAEIDRFLAETEHTIESLHEVSESAPKRTAALRTQAGVAEIWNGFVGWIRDIFGTFSDIDQSLDSAITALDQVAGAGVQASMRHIATNKRADILEVMGTKEALTNPSLLQLFAALFKIQPIAMGEMKQVTSDLSIHAREVQIPRIPEDVRAKVMAVINQTAIKPEVQEAMQLLVAMQKANKALAAKVAEVQAQFGGNESLRKAVPKATETVLKYVAKLTNKQRRFEDALFRATSRVQRGAVDYKTAIETLRTAAAAASDEVLVNKIDELLAAGTRAAKTIPDLEIIMDEVPTDAVEQLRAIQGPAPAAAPVPSTVAFMGAPTKKLCELCSAKLNEEDDLGICAKCEDDIHEEIFAEERTKKASLSKVSLLQISNEENGALKHVWEAFEEGMWGQPDALIRRQVDKALAAIKRIAPQILPGVEKKLNTAFQLQEKKNALYDEGKDDEAEGISDKLHSMNMNILSPFFIDPDYEVSEDNLVEVVDSVKPSSSNPKTAPSVETATPKGVSGVPKPPSEAVSAKDMELWYRAVSRAGEGAQYVKIKSIWMAYKKRGD